MVSRFLAYKETYLEQFLPWCLHDSQYLQCKCISLPVCLDIKNNYFLYIDTYIYKYILCVGRPFALIFITMCLSAGFELGFDHWGTFSFLGGQKFVHPSFLAGLLIGLGRKSQISKDF